MVERFKAQVLKFDRSPHGLVLSARPVLFYLQIFHFGVHSAPPHTALGWVEKR